MKCNHNKNIIMFFKGIAIVLGKKRFPLHLKNNVNNYEFTFKMCLKIEVISPIPNFTSSPFPHQLYPQTWLLWSIWCQDFLTFFLLWKFLSPWALSRLYTQSAPKWGTRACIRKATHYGQFTVFRGTLISSI